MSMSFLEYYKLILEKVSFSQELFAKEYRKARRSLSSDEVKKLEGWLTSRGFDRLLTFSPGYYYEQPTNAKVGMSH